MTKSVGSEVRCQRCNKGVFLTDSNTGEMFCSKCGFVATDRIEQEGPEWRAFSKYEGDNRSHVHEPADRNFRQAFSELDRLKPKLALSDAIIEKTAYIYRKALDKSLVIGCSIPGLIAASLYVVCRNTETPRTLTDVLNGINIKRKDIARCYRLLLRELDLKIPVVNPVKCVSRISSIAGLSEKTKRKAGEILDQSAKIELSAGKDPMGLAAALYLSCVINGENKTQKEIVVSAGVTEITIRNKYKGLEEALEL